MLSSLYGPRRKPSVVARLLVSLVPLFVMTLMTAPTLGQNVLYQEGFNDDGDGTRYFTEGRGFGFFPDGPGMWEHNFLSDEIGLATTASAKRAAILSSTELSDFTFTDEHLEVWDALVDWMVDGKENANVLWIPGFSADSASDFLSFRMDEQGYITDEHDGTADLPDPSEVDLVIHSGGGPVTPPTKFVGYEVPLITFNAGNHDDTLIASIGAVNLVDPPEITVVEENKDHPVLGGKTGIIPWATEVVNMQGIGAAVPTGSTVLATYVDPDTQLVLPAIVLVEEGGNLLGAFSPEPEGTGFFVGASTDDADFGEGASTAEVPKALELNPVNVAGEENVKVSVALAATGVDFEESDFLRVLYAPDGNSDFEVLTEFVGVNDASSPNNKSLSNGEIVLSPDHFTDITLDIPEGATDLAIRFEVHNTFPNEIVAIDNVRVLAGTASPGDCNGDGVVNVADANCTSNDGLDAFLASLDPASLRGDANGDGVVQFEDLVVLSNNFGNPGEYTDGDFDKDGVVQFGDLVILSDSFGQSAGGAVAASVPEPSTAILLLAGGLVLFGRRRRR